MTLLLETGDLCDDWYSKHTTDSGDGATSNNKEEDTMHTKCVNRKNESGLSPLIVACERNLPLIAELLLKHGADLCIQDSKGRNPLAVASFCGCNDVVESLINKTEALSLLLDTVDLTGCTPLWLAARTGNLSMVKLLMINGANATIKNNEDLTPQDVAIKFKKEKVVDHFSQLLTQ